MSLISSRLSLTHTCTIQRSTATTDDWGNPGPPVWADHLVDQPCRHWATAGREVVANTTTVVVVEDLRLLLPLGTDVTEADRVTSILYRGGTVQDGPLDIRGLLAHQDHLELILVQVGS